MSGWMNEWNIFNEEEERKMFARINFNGQEESEFKSMPMLFVEIALIHCWVSETTDGGRYEYKE